jgi:hypothetical protein
MDSITQDVLWEEKVQRLYGVNKSSEFMVSWWVCGFYSGVVRELQWSVVGRIVCGSVHAWVCVRVWACVGVGVCVGVCVWVCVGVGVCVWSCVWV